MPIPAIVAAAGITAAAQGANMYAQGKTNQKTRIYNTQMYHMQREHALADWNMANNYNSPQAQMDRFRTAGLNPNLIYGQQNEAPATRSSDVKAWNPTAPRFEMDGGSILMQHQHIKMQQAQMDSIAVSNQLKEAERLVKMAQISSITQKTAKDKFDLDLSSELRNNTISAAQAGLNKTLADTQFTLNQDERNAASNAQTIQESASRILNMRQQNAQSQEEVNRIKRQIQGLTLDNRLKELDIQLKKNGIQPGDPLYMRILGQIVNDKEGGAAGAIKRFGTGILDGLKNMWRK